MSVSFHILVSVYCTFLRRFVLFYAAQFQIFYLKMSYIHFSFHPFFFFFPPSSCFLLSFLSSPLRAVIAKNPASGTRLPRIRSQLWWILICDLGTYCYTSVFPSIFLCLMDNNALLHRDVERIVWVNSLVCKILNIVSST